MTELVNATEDTFESILDDLLAENSPVRRKFWRKIFSYAWKREENYNGFILKNEGHVVGFLGTIFSKRIVDGRTYKFCNLTTWMVKPEFRNQSLRLLYPVLKMKDHIITIHGGSERAVAIYKKLGFELLDEHYVVPLGIFNFFSWQNTPRLEIIMRPDDIRSLLGENHRAIFDDHKGLGVDNAVILDKENGDYCYVVYGKKVKKGIPVTYIYYISDEKLFAQGIRKLHLKLLLHTWAPIILIDSRFLHDVKPSWGIKLRTDRKRLYLNRLIGKDRIDFLYSEVILSDLPI